MEEKYYAVTREDTNDLQHFKYVKRIKKKGKWVYYYPGDLKEDIANEFGVKAKRDYKNAKKRVAKFDRDIEAHNKKYDSNERVIEIAEKRKDKAMLDTLYKRRSDMGDKALSLASKGTRATERMMKAKKTYYKTPMGKMDKAIRNGKKKFKKLTRKWFKK